MQTVFQPDLSVVEVIVLSSFVLIVFTFAVDVYVGKDIGDDDRLQMAKLQAQQELMAVHNRNE